jgi:four helix bundle protein
LDADGTLHALNRSVTANSVDDLKVYQKALSVAHEVSAIIRSPSFRRDPELRSQLGASSSRVPSNIAEGFEQKTDRHFAHFLYIARGSAKESKTHLNLAAGRGCVSSEEALRVSGTYDEIARMLTRLIQHLESEDRKRRWRGSSRTGDR